jgi:hypothetical protein
MMPEPFYELSKAIQDIHHRDRKDTTYRVSPDVWDAVLKASPRPQADPPPTTALGQLERSLQPDMLLGIPVVVDENLPPRTVLVDVENAYDRALRRAAERGLPVIVQKMPPLDLSTMPAPLPPTFKALLRKWWRKLVRR